MMKKSNQHADPMKTKTGKIRLGPLNIQQLHDLLSKESKPKNKSKIKNRIEKIQRQGYEKLQEL